MENPKTQNEKGKVKLIQNDHNGSFEKIQADIPTCERCRAVHIQIAAENV